jgi:hypothetical protein
VSNKTFRAVLFYVLLSIFCATAVVEIAALWGIRKLPDDVQPKLFTLLITEVIASVFAFWKQINAKPFSDPPPINGRWEYECIREDNTYKHGGFCSIEIRQERFGWEFRIGGKRTWVAKRKDGTKESDWERETLAAPSHWENTWGTFTGTDNMRYAYSVNSGGRVIQGYGWASIKFDDKGEPNVMEGNFFQLPPHDPFFGGQRYWRVDQGQ